MQQTSFYGTLIVEVIDKNLEMPIENAVVELYSLGDSNQLIEEATSDIGGWARFEQLEAPPLENSMEPGSITPYSQFNVVVKAEGYRRLEIGEVEVYPDEVSLQRAYLELEEEDTGPIDIIVPQNTLLEPEEPKIPEPEIKPVTESGEIVLSRVVIPEYIVVHDGVPSDRGAKNYYVPYGDYIKNVASSEIYATWPDATIRANVLAIMSFTLNRVYTEWYRNKGYDFTITSSTAYDQKWSYGRTIFQRISRIVDEMYPNYLSRPNVKQPILTQYCDGRNSSCPNWLSQWGSKYLGDQGYRTIEILRYYYGRSMYINTAEQIQGIPSSWPGAPLQRGSRGSKVRQVQEELNAIAKHYPRIPRVDVDGIYGPKTEASVKVFQSVFGLPATGIVNYPTWYKLSQIYVGVTKIGEGA